MTAAQRNTQKDKHTGIRKETIRKTRKVGSKAQKQEHRTQGIHSNKVSCLCYKTEPGTLPHNLPSSRSRRQWYQVSLLPLSSLTSVN